MGKERKDPKYPFTVGDVADALGIQRKHNALKQLAYRIDRNPNVTPYTCKNGQVKLSREDFELLTTKTKDPVSPSDVNTKKETKLDRDSQKIEIFLGATWVGKTYSPGKDYY